MKSSKTRDSAQVANEAAEFIRRSIGNYPFDVAVILGSGWKDSTSQVGEKLGSIRSEIVPGFSASSVPGHVGALEAVRSHSGRNVLLIGARAHLYEGKDTDAVAHGVRTAAACGAKIMILTNGAGGIRESWAPGQPGLISDHINLTATSPLGGANFVDLTDLYSRRLREVARTIDPTLEEGVYVQFRGPQYETPAEVRMAKAMGGDIVGMSTALEAIAAREAGMEVLGLSLITNLAAGKSPHP